MKYGAIILALFIALFLWGGEVTGLFDAPNGWFYDRLVSVSFSEEVPKSNILVVDTGHAPEVIRPSDWEKLLSELGKHKPTLVAFTFVPPLDLKQSAKEGIPYLIGVAPELQSPDYHSPLNGYDELSTPRGHTSLLSRPKSKGGIYRFADLYINNQPAFSLTIAQMIGRGDMVADVQRLRINFNHGADWLPVVSFQRAMTGGLIPELVQDRVVLIGSVTHLNSPGLATPVSRDSGTLSLTEFEGYTIETLLHGNAIKELPAILIILLLLSLSAVSLIAYQRMTMTMAWRLTFIVILIFHIVAWVQLHWATMWLPLLPLVLNQILLLLLVVRYRQIGSEEALHHVLSDAGSWVRGHLMPEDFYASDQHWAQVANLVDQSLDLQRLIFLERIEGDHRVREVNSLRCSIDTIDERRRDYERTPYSTAIEKGGPIRLSKQYLEPFSEPEQQYLVPLSYAGEIVGFWAFSVAPDRHDNLEEFESVVKDFSVQIAEILYHRSVWQAEQAASSKPLMRYLDFRAGDDLNQRVIWTLNSLERRWGMLEQVLGELVTCTALYDPFGSVLSANKSMEQLSGNYDMSLYEMSALDFLVKLTNMPVELARNMLSTVIFQKKELQFPVSLEKEGKNTFLLSIRPVGRDETHKLAVDEATPFDIRGLLFEIIDPSEFSEIAGIKSQYMERLLLQLRNDMEAVMTGVQLLSSDRMSVDQHQRTMEIILDKVKNTNTRLIEAEGYIDVGMNEVMRSSYPIDTISIVNTILSRRGDELNQKKIEVVKSFPDLLQLGLAKSDNLTALLNNILDIQIEDAGPDSQLYFSITSEEGAQYMKIRGTGFGMPDEELQRFLKGDVSMVSEQFKRLRKGIEHVSSWGGELKMSSELGKGITFELKLRSVF